MLEWSCCYIKTNRNVICRMKKCQLESKTTQLFNAVTGRDVYDYCINFRVLNNRESIASSPVYRSVVTNIRGSLEWLKSSNILCLGPLLCPLAMALIRRHRRKFKTQQNCFLWKIKKSLRTGTFTVGRSALDLIHTNTVYLAVAGWTWPGYGRRELVACLCRARKDWPEPVLASLSSAAFFCIDIPILYHADTISFSS